MRAQLVAVACLALLLTALPRCARAQRPPARHDRAPAGDETLEPDDPENLPDGADPDQDLDGGSPDVQDDGPDDVPEPAAVRPPTLGAVRGGTAGPDEQPPDTPRVDPPAFDEAKPAGPVNPQAPLAPE